VTTLSQGPGGENGSGKWFDRVVEKAGGKAVGVTPAAVRHTADITPKKTPKTYAGVMAGEPGYQTIQSAKRKAKEEIARASGQEDQPVEKETVRSHPRSVFKELGNALSAFRSILREDSQLDPGKPEDAHKLEQRVIEIETMWPQVLTHMRRQNWIAES
jgi:hypothetical protein